MILKLSMFPICFILLLIFQSGMSRLKPGQLNSAEIETVLSRHNYLRRLQKSSNMNILKWNDTLAEMAYNYLQKCMNVHGQPERPRSPFMETGQNIYAVSPWKESNYSWAIQRWYDEIVYYNYDRNTCSDKCGHYTQVVWADSMYVGCASKNCSVMQPQGWRNATMILCNYGPPGNYPGMRPFELGISCEMCRMDLECINGLCDLDPDY